MSLCSSQDLFTFMVHEQLCVEKKRHKLLLRQDPHPAKDCVKEATPPLRKFKQHSGPALLLS